MKEWLKAKSVSDVGIFYSEKYKKDGFGAFKTPNHEFFFRWLIENFGGFKKNQSIVDFGCGHGEFITEVLRYSENLEIIIFGIDVSHEAILLAENRLGDKAALEYSSINEASLKEESFDFATSWGVLEHTMNPSESFRKILSVLKPGGHAFITVPIEFENCFSFIMEEENQITNERFASAEEWLGYFSDIKKPIYHEITGGDMKDIFMVFKK